MSNGFRNIQTTASDARVKVPLVQALAQFVDRGLERFGYSKSGVRTAPVVNAILATLADSMVQGFPERKTAHDEVVLRVLAAYFDEYEANCRLFFKESVTPVPITGWEVEREEVRARYGEQDHPQTNPTVADALALAWVNLRRARQRCVSWHCLGAMFHNTAAGRQRDSAESHDLDAVSQALLAEERIMKSRLLMLAILEGGTAADQVKEWLKRTSFGSGMSIMEYLEVDGQVPSRWLTVDEETFRSALAAA